MRKKLGVDRVSIYCALESDSMSDDNKNEMEVKTVQKNGGIGMQYMELFHKYYLLFFLFLF